MKKIIASISAILVCATSLNVRAQQVLTLDECKQMAIENNNALKTAQQKIASLHSILHSIVCSLKFCPPNLNQCFFSGRQKSAVLRPQREAMRLQKSRRKERWSRLSEPNTNFRPAFLHRRMNSSWGVWAKSLISTATPRFTSISTMRSNRSRVHTSL